MQHAERHPSSVAAAVPVSAFIPASESAVLSCHDGLLHVQAPPRQWAYAAIACLPDCRISGPARVSVRARVDGGAMGFGVLTKDGRGFVAEECLSGGQSGTIVLSVPSLADAGSLVIRSWAPTGTVAEAVIAGVELCRDDATGVDGNDGAPLEGRPIPSHYWFLKYLKARLPILTEPGASDWQKVNAVREWAYAEIPRADTSALLSIRTDLPPEAAFASFDELRGGVYCGGTAVLLSSVYRCLGYEAYTYNAGTTTDYLSHVVTVVGIQHGGAKVLAVEDAYFNFTLSTPDGGPADLRHVLQMLEADDLAAIVVTPGHPSSKPVVTRVERLDTLRAYHARHYTLGSPIVRDGMATYRHDFSLATFEGLADYEAWIDSRIGRANFLYLFLFPLGTSGGREIMRVAEEALAIQRRLSGNEAASRP